MSHLASADWRYDPNLLSALGSHTVGDYLMLEVFDRAMALLHGCLRNGSVYHHTLNLWSQYPPINPSESKFGYEEEQMESLFRSGEFMYGRRSIYYASAGACPELQISDTHSEIKSWAIGMGFPGEPRIEIDWSYFSTLSADHPDVFTNDVAGRDRLGWELAGLVLHEVTHTHGFLHPGFDEVHQTFTAIETRDSEFDPRHEYYRTLPCIAEHAVYLVADEHFSGTGYDRAKARRWPVSCGCRANTGPQSKGPTGGAAVIPDQDWQKSRAPVPIRVKRSGQ